MTKLNTLVRIGKILYVGFALLLAVIALLFFFSGTQSYFNGNRSNSAMGNIVLSVALVCFPLSIFFGYKAAKKYLLPTPNYQLPESPGRTMLYIALTGGFVMTTAVAIIVFLFYLNA